MKTFVHVIRLALAGVFLLSGELQAAPANVTITGYNAGPTPFIIDLHLTVTDRDFTGRPASPALLASISGPCGAIVNIDSTLV